MPTEPVDNVTLNVIFNKKTKTLSVDGNPTPVELFEITVALLAQLVPVFNELDGAIRARAGEKTIIVPARDLVVANGKIH